MFNHLQKDGYITAEASPLLRAGEKLATENEILRHEIQGLRKATTEEKEKRKRGQAIELFEGGEDPGQALFFSPSRIGRAHQRIADEAQAEQQRKQAAQDRRLQLATIRAEKAPEAEETKAARIAARNAAREKRAAEKARRAAEKAAQRAKKLEEAAKRQEDAAREEAQRTAPKKAEASATKLDKRRFVGEEPGAPSKRRCAKPSTPRRKQEAGNSRMTSGSLGN